MLTIFKSKTATLPSELFDRCIRNRANTNFHSNHPNYTPYFKEWRRLDIVDGYYFTEFQLFNTSPLELAEIVKEHNRICDAIYPTNQKPTIIDYGMDGHDFGSQKVTVPQLITTLLDGNDVDLEEVAAIANDYSYHGQDAYQALYKEVYPNAFSNA